MQQRERAGTAAVGERKLPAALVGHLSLAAILAVAVFLNFYLMLHHELWRDEAQAWLIAGSTNPVSLIQDITSYEGHPFLWYTILIPFAKLGFPYRTISVISFLVMSGTMCLIVAKAPFDDLLKGLIIISPYCVFFYATIARNYCLAALFIIMLAWQHRDCFKKPFVYCTVLALLIQTHVVLIGFAFGLCVEMTFRALVLCWQEKKFRVRPFLALLLPLISALFYFVEFHDINHAVTMSSVNVVLTAESVWYHLKEGCESVFGNWKAIVLLLGAAALVPGIRRVTGPVLVTLLALASQGMLFNFKSHRDLLYGFYVIWLLWVLWDELKIADAGSKWRRTAALFGLSALLILAIIPKYREYDYIYRDIDGLFTDAPNVAEYMDESLSDAVVFECCQEISNSVIPYLEKASLMDPFRRADAGYVIWNRAEITALSYDEFLHVASEMFPEAKEIYLLCPETINQNLSHVYDVPEDLAPVYRSGKELCSGNLEYYSIYRIPMGNEALDANHGV